MKDSINNIFSYPRHNRTNKDCFINDIKSWCSTNLTNFNVNIQKTYIMVNYIEIFKSIFLLLNIVFIYFIILELPQSWFLSLLFVLMIYAIQFKLALITIPILIPSKNIIISNHDNPNNKSNIIICAHYDTKPCLLNLESNNLVKAIKHFYYCVCRIIARVLWQSQIVAIIFISTFYVYYLCTINDSISKVFGLLNSFPYLLESMIDLILMLLANCIICIGVVLFLSFPFRNKAGNPGADDNTSGVIGALNIAKELDNEKNLNLDIILFDNEEKGLIGSTHYVFKNAGKLLKKDTVVINLDCIGRGEDIFITTDKFYNNACLNLLSNHLENRKFSCYITDIDYSDHKSFEMAGFDSITIGRYKKSKFLWNKEFPSIDWIHGNQDQFEKIDIQKINEVSEMVVKAIKNAEILRTRS